MQDSTVANARARPERPPIAVNPHIYFAICDALSEPSVFANARDIKSHRSREMEDNLACGYAIVGRPIRLGVVIQYQFWTKGRVVGPNVRSHDVAGLSGEILRKDLAYPFAETA